MSVDQFFRALESMGLIFTDSERYYLEQKYATATYPREICYQDVVDELETPLLDPSLAPKGSRGNYCRLFHASRSGFGARPLDSRGGPPVQRASGAAAALGPLQTHHWETILPRF